MTEIEKLRYEYNELVTILNMAREYALLEKDPKKIEEYRTHLLRSYDIIKEKKDKLDLLKAKSAASSNKTTTDSAKKKTDEKKYYYVLIYHPFLTIGQMKYLTIERYRYYDKIKEVYDEKGTRSKKGLFGYYDETYYYKHEFPIIVEKDGNKIYDLITGLELMEYNNNERDYETLRYKDKIIISKEKYLGNKIVVELKSEIKKAYLADLLKKLDNSSKNDYIYKMEQLRSIIMAANNDYYNEKKLYLQKHGTDDDIIKKYRGR